jgi:hypothetical protein
MAAGLLKNCEGIKIGIKKLIGIAQTGDEQTGVKEQ